MKCNEFGTGNCGTESYDGCIESDECDELIERISKGKTVILDSKIMDKIKSQDEELFGMN